MINIYAISYYHDLLASRSSHPSSSPAPATARSALLSWICSMATPMQCAPVEQAEPMENEGPCSVLSLF